MTDAEKICELQTKVVEYEHCCRLLSCLLQGRNDVQEDFIFFDEEVEHFYDLLYHQISELLNNQSDEEE